MKSSIRSTLSKSVDINVINNLLNYELRTSKIIRPSLDSIHFKILVPCVAAGAIIGKGGEAIAVIQKESGAKVKISKSYDFYPGTTERICLIMGPIDAVTKVHDYIIEKIQEKPEQLSRQIIDIKGVVERHKQVKILVPNSTAGMIIGKSGCYIKEIKEKSGSFVQISQKSKEVNLPERCITIAGEQEQNCVAVTMILAKISEDPHSASCPTISYVDIVGPVASAYPTGSPYAMIGHNCGGSSSISQQAQPPAPEDTTEAVTVAEAGSYPLLMGCSSLLDQSQVAPMTTAGFLSSHLMELDYYDDFSVSGTSPVIPPAAGQKQQQDEYSASELVRNILRLSGFSQAGVDAITSAIQTLCQYGLTNCAQQLSLRPASSTPPCTSTTAVSLYDSLPLYTNPLEDVQTAYPLDFLINSYLGHCNYSTTATCSSHSLHTDQSADIGDGFIRYLEVRTDKASLLSYLDSPLAACIFERTSASIKVDEEKSRPHEGMFCLQVAGPDIDSVLDAIGMIIYSSVDLHAVNCQSNPVA